MKAIDVRMKLLRQFPNPYLDYFNERGYKSSVDETKTLQSMLIYWLELFESYPDMRIGSITKYNINRDFNCL